MITSLTSLTTSTTVSRRSLLKLGLGSALGVGLAASGLSLLGSPESTVGAALPPFQAYHGVTGATHQAKFNDLSANGYRMISLAIYGDPNDARYAAVWVQKPGGGYIAMHGITADEYQSRFNDATSQGYVPVLVSATGPANNARFAAVFEQGITGSWKARHGLISGDANTPGTVEHEYQQAYTDKQYMRSVAVYGTASDRRYAAIWHTNTGTYGNLFQPAKSASDYQQLFDSLAGSSLGYRPSALAVATDTTIASVFRSDKIGPWIARHNLTSDQYQQAFNDATAQGYIPICVQGGGIGSATRYAAIFAMQLP